MVSWKVINGRPKGYILSDDVDLPILICCSKTKSYWINISWQIYLISQRKRKVSNPHIPITQSQHLNPIVFFRHPFPKSLTPIHNHTSFPFVGECGHYSSNHFFTISLRRRGMTLSPNTPSVIQDSLAYVDIDCIQPYKDGE